MRCRAYGTAPPCFSGPGGSLPCAGCIPLAGATPTEFAINAANPPYATKLPNDLFFVTRAPTPENASSSHLTRRVSRLGAGADDVSKNYPAPGTPSRR
jgi:hypothetical protein